MVTPKKFLAENEQELTNSAFAYMCENLNITSKNNLKIIFI